MLVAFFIFLWSGIEYLFFKLYLLEDIWERPEQIVRNLFTCFINIGFLCNNIYKYCFPIFLQNHWKAQDT